MNSTNVRLIGQILSDTAPGLAARWAERLFFTPPRTHLSPRLRAFLTTGRFREIQLNSDRVAVWSWGQGPPVYLLHGWAGRGAQLASFGPPLVLAGFTVVTLDAPGHGASSGRRASIFDFARALRATVDRFGPAAAVVAHSLGAAATAHALVDGLRARRAVFIAPPADPNDWTRRFADRLGISGDVLHAMKERTERRLGVPWGDLSVPRLGAALGVPLLVVHDRDDEEVPSSDGAAIAESWPGARLVTTRGLGHHRILRDPSVVHEVVSFVRTSTPRSERERLDLLSESFFLERYLFDREWRWSLAKAESIPLD